MEAFRSGLFRIKKMLVEAIKAGDSAPECIQITDDEGRERGTVLLEDLLQGPGAD